MGAWSTAIFADDLAADLKGDFRDLIGDGLSSTQAVERLQREYAEALEDERSVFWLALAKIQWTLGRLEDRTKRAALEIINNGSDLNRWDDPADRKSRGKALARLKAQLLSPQPPARPVPRRIRSDNDWSVGEIIAFRLVSGRWALMRVIGHHQDKDGRSAICELLDSATPEIPAPETIANLALRRGNDSHGISQFLFQEPRRTTDKERVVRLGITGVPVQDPGGYTALVWPFVDELMKRLFDLE